MFIVWSLIFLLIIAVSLWNMFEKAGEEGWKGLIPIYNTFILAKIAGRPMWLALFIYIPYVLNNFAVSNYVTTAGAVVAAVVYLVISIDLAKAFGKSVAFGVIGLFFFSFFGFMMLGWGDAKYTKPTATS